MKKINLLFTFIFSLLVIVLIYSGYKIFSKYKEKIVAEQNNPIVKVDYNTENIISKMKKTYNNEDIIGVLNIANMDLIVVQGNDNKFYLNHLLNKEQNSAGSIFLDYRENVDTSKQLNIFGHTSDYYYLPFNDLMNFMDYNFYQKNKNVTLTTENDTYKYEIFSVKKTEEENHLDISFNNLDEYKTHLDELKKDSLYETNVDVQVSDKILIIQTCIINDPKSLLIINLRKVEEE